MHRRKQLRLSNVKGDDTFTVYDMEVCFLPRGCSELDSMWQERRRLSPRRLDVVVSLDKCSIKAHRSVLMLASPLVQYEIKNDMAFFMPSVTVQECHNFLSVVYRQQFTIPYCQLKRLKVILQRYQVLIPKYNVRFMKSPRHIIPEVSAIPYESVAFWHTWQDEPCQSNPSFEPAHSQYQQVAQSVADVPLRQVDLQAPSEASGGVRERTQQQSAPLDIHFKDAAGAHSQATGITSTARSDTEVVQLTSTHSRNPRPHKTLMALVSDHQMILSSQGALPQWTPAHSEMTLEQLVHLYSHKTEQLAHLYSDTNAPPQVDLQALSEVSGGAREKTQLLNAPLGMHFQEAASTRSQATGISFIAHSNADENPIELACTRAQNSRPQVIPPPPVNNHSQEVLPPSPGALPQWSPAHSEMTFEQLAHLYSDTNAHPQVDLQAPSEARDGARERTQQPSAQLDMHYQEVAGAHPQATGIASMAHSNAEEPTELTSTGLQHPSPQEIPPPLVRDPQTLPPSQDALQNWSSTHSNMTLEQMAQLYSGMTLEQLAHLDSGETLKQLVYLYSQALFALRTESPTLFQQQTQTRLETQTLQQAYNIQNPSGPQMEGNSFPRATPDSGTPMNQPQTRILAVAGTVTHTNAVLATRPQSRIRPPPGLSQLSTYREAPVLDPVNSLGHAPNPVNSPANVINPVNSPDNIFNPKNTPDSVLNPVNSPANVFNPINSPGHILNPVNSPGHVLNPFNSPGHVFNPVNSPANVPNPVNSSGNVFNQLNFPENVFNPVNSPNNVFNPVNSPANVFNSVNSPANVFDLVNSQVNVFNPVNSPANVFNSVNSSDNVLNPVNSPGHVLNPVNSPGHVFNPVNSPGNVFNTVNYPGNILNPGNALANVPNPVNSLDKVFNQLNSQANVFNPVSSPANVFNPVNSPANVFNPVNSTGHVFNPVNSQANLLDPVNSQANVFNSVNSPANVFNPVNSSSNLLDLLNSKANISNPVNSPYNVSNPVNSPSNVFKPINSPDNVFKPVNSPANVFNPVNSRDNVFNPVNSPDNAFNRVSSPGHVLKPVSQGHVFNPVDSPAHVLKPVNSPDHILKPVSSKDHILNPANSPAHVLNPESSLSRVLSPLDSPVRVCRPVDSPARVLSTLDSPRRALGSVSTSAHVLNPVSSPAHLLNQINSPNVTPSTSRFPNQAASQAQGLSTLQGQTEQHPLRPRAAYPAQAYMQNYRPHLHEMQVCSQTTRTHAPLQNLYTSDTYSRPSSSATAVIRGQGVTTDTYSHLRGMPDMPNACSSTHRDNQQRLLMQSYASNYIGHSPIRPSGVCPPVSGYPIGAGDAYSHAPRLPDTSQVSQHPTAVVSRVNPSAMHAQGPGHPTPSFNTNPIALGSSPTHAQGYLRSLREVPVRYNPPGVNGRQLYQMLQSSPPRFEREAAYSSRQGAILPQYPHGRPPLQLPHYYLRRQ